MDGTNTCLPGPRRGPRGALVVSLDFEQHWGMRDKWSVGAVRDQLLGTREAVPAILRLFAEFRIHATWATVGFLFFESKREMIAALPARRPAYRSPGLSPYDELGGIGDGEADDPFHFAPSMIRRIAETPGQEIGSHTFSHYYCLEEGQSLDDFRADMAAAVRVTRQKTGRALRSIVFPRNQLSPEYIAVCRELGLTAYRGTLGDWVYRPRTEDGESILRRGVRLVDAYVSLTGSNSRPLDPALDGAPVDVPASRYLRPYSVALRHLEPLRLRRIRRDLSYAARSGRTFHLWWHPHDFGLHLQQNLANLREILSCFTTLRERSGMESVGMAEAAERAIVAAA